MKKYLYSLIVILIVTGCTTSKKVVSKKASKEKTEEELVWIDAKKDEIYNQRIFLQDKKSQYDKKSDYEFSKDLDKLNELTSTNKFASKFIELYNKTNISEFTNNSIESIILSAYLTIKTNHCEGLCIHNSDIDNSLSIFSDDVWNVSKIYYIDKHFDANLNPIISSNEKINASMIIEFTNKDDESKKYILTNVTIDTKDYYDTFNIMGVYSSYDEAVNESVEKWVNIYKAESRAAHEFNWNELSGDVINKVIVNNNEFLNFYIKYKNDIYYKKSDSETISDTSSSNETSKKKSPYIGMTASEVESSTWGSPNKINKDTYSWGTKEQWVYSRGYIYFENGRVTSISER